MVVAENVVWNLILVGCFDGDPGKKLHSSVSEIGRLVSMRRRISMLEEFSELVEVVVRCFY